MQSTSWMVASLVMKVLHVICGFGRVLTIFSTCGFALPVASGFSLEHAIANRSIAARVSSCSYTVPVSGAKFGADSVIVW